MKDYLRYLWYWICKYPLSLLPNNLFFNIQYNIVCLRHGYKHHWLNINNPRRFNEKIHWLKLHPCVKEGELLADKYRVREYIKHTIGEKYLIPLIGVWDKVDEIELAKLPNKFVLKANHGSGMNIICKDKSKIDWNKAKNKMRFWLKNSQYCLSREWQYKDTPRKIICEQFLKYDITDYKFFCFNGRPKYIQVDIDRFKCHRRSFFTDKWESAPFTTLYEQPEKMPEKPTQLEEMLGVATKLAKDYAFARIDLYIHENKVYFGEITLHPEGGCGIYIPDEYDFIMGDMLKLK